MLMKLRKGEQGQALVELALILPILVILVFGIIEFGRVFNAQLIVSQSAREGARQGTVGATDAQIITAVKNSAGSLDTMKLDIAINPREVYRKRGASMSVSVQYPVALYIPLLNTVLPNPLNVKGTTIMRVE